MNSKIVGRWVPSKIVALFLVMAGVGATGWCQAGSFVEQGLLSPEGPRELEIPAGDSHVFDLELDPLAVWRIEVEKLGVDLRLEIESGGEVVQAVDNPMIRSGPEILVLDSRTSGPLRLVVSGVAGRAVDGKYRLALSRFADPSRGDGSPSPRLRWERALTRAGELSATRDPSTRDQVLEIYRVAGSDPPSGADRRLQAMAWSAYAQLAYEMDRVDEALAGFRTAFPIWKSLGDDLLAANALGNIGLIYLDRGDHEKGREFLSSSMELQEAIGNSYGAAVTLGNLCWADFNAGSPGTALPCFERVLELHRAGGSLLAQANALINIGGALSTLGRTTDALEYFHQGWELHRELGNSAGEALALHNLAWNHERVGEFQQALEFYTQALEGFRHTGDRRGEARSLNNLGATYWRLGDLPRAQTLLERAIPLRRQAQHQSGEAVSLSLLGRLYLRQGASDQALEVLEQALDLSRAMSDPRREGRILGILGEAHLARNEQNAAEEHLNAGLELVMASEDLQSEGRIRFQRARLSSARGAYQEAVSELNRCLDLARTIRSPPLEMGALVEMARVERRRGNLEQAIERSHEALEIIEGLRTPVTSLTLRASLTSNLREGHELAIDLEIERYQSTGEARFLRQAFHLSERARARSLLDLLSELSTPIGERDLPGELTGQLREARRRLNNQATAQSLLLQRDPQSSEAEAAAQAVAEALIELERAEAEVRRLSPVAADLKEPELLTTSQVEALLDPDTLWLQYALGEERSFLWAIEPGSVELHVLPHRGAIEPMVRRLHRRLSTYAGSGADWDTDEDALDLSKALLGPVANRLAKVRRLVVVPDSALHYLPFAALPIPGAGTTSGDPLGPEPLITQAEVVSLPSASTLALQRRRRASRPVPESSVLVVADPVFDATDPRLSGAETLGRARSDGMVAPAEVGPALRRDGSSAFSRLPASRAEAEAIANLYPAERRTLLLDFEASREDFFRAVSGQRILHIATHGVLDSERPALSGLVLSQLGPEGTPREGFLRLHDLYDLDLQAELVVLSGCRTALGREIRGEGLVGLTRGFMDAGADRVLASLWSVQDRATAELMIAFHRNLSEGLSAAAALRSAQLEIRRNRRWKDPYFWSAFVVQGDWR